MLLPIHPFLDGVSIHLNFTRFTNLLTTTYYLLNTYLLQCPHSYTGWHPSHIKIYFHQAESLLIQRKDEIVEIASSLKLLLVVVKRRKCYSIEMHQDNYAFMSTVNCQVNLMFSKLALVNRC